MILLLGSYVTVEGGLHGISKGNRHGYIDRDGEVVVECKLYDAGVFEDGIAVVGPPGPYRYVMDKSGRLVTKLQYSHARNWGERCVISENYNEPGYDYRNPVFVVTCVKDSIASHHELPKGITNVVTSLIHGHALAVADGRLVAIDRMGKKRMVFPHNHRAGTILGNGYVLVKVRIPLQESTDETVPECRRTIRFAGFAVYDRDYRVVVPPRQYEDMGDFADKRAPVKDRESGLWGYIDEDNTMVIPPRFAAANEFSDGLALVRPGIPRARKRGTVQAKAEQRFIAPSGEVALSELPGDEVFDFHCGRAAFRSRDKHGFIDKNGKVVVEPKFDYVWPFRNGLALVNIGGEVVENLDIGECFLFKGGKYAYINRRGDIVWGPVTLQREYPQQARRVPHGVPLWSDELIRGMLRHDRMSWKKQLNF